MTVELYKSTHSTKCVSSVAAYIYNIHIQVLAPSVALEYVINASTTVGVNREIESPLTPDGDGRERLGTHLDNSEGGADSGWSEFMN